MGTLGKVFLFINFVVAVGAVYLATQTYAKRQEVSSVGLRHLLTLNGLPVESPKGTTGDSEYPLEMDLPQGHSIDSVRKKTLDAHFQGADGGNFPGGGTPTSQMKEIQRVQGKVKEDVRAANGAAAKLVLLAGQYTQNGFRPGLLTTLAETYDERMFVRRLATSQDPAAIEAAVATAEAMLDKKFAAVTAAPSPARAAEEATKIKEAGEAVRAAGERIQQAAVRLQADPANNQFRQQLEQLIQKDLPDAEKAMRDVLTDIGSAATRDDGDRRVRIAHLLMLVDSNATWQKRVALVVGLRTYVRALGAQADRLGSMIVSANQQMVFDQAEFVDKFEMYKNLAYQRAILLQQQQVLNAEVRTQKANDAELAGQRNIQLVRRQQELAALQSQVAAVLARQAEVEATVFALQQKVGATLQENFDLEAKLEAAEQKGR